VAGEVQPGQDEGGLDLRDAAGAEAADLAELATGIQVHHVADRARLIERRVVGAGQRVEAVQRQQWLSWRVRAWPPCMLCHSVLVPPGPGAGAAAGMGPSGCPGSVLHDGRAA